MSTLRVSGHLSWHGGQALGARALRVAPHDLARERAPLPLPGVCSRVALHPLGRQIRHRHLGFDARTRPSRSLPAFGHDPQGCSKRVFKTWLASQPDTWRERIEIVAMDGFTGFKKAQPPKNSPARGRSWIPSTSHTLPGMLSMSAAGASSQNFTIVAGVPRSLTEIITLGRTLSRIK